VIEIVDREDKISAFLSVLEKMLAIALITLEKVKSLQLVISDETAQALLND
jgi:PII-like signaling protein